jgi:hypothetical protein
LAKTADKAALRLLASTTTHERQLVKKEQKMSFEDMATLAQNPRNLPVEFEFDSTLVRTIAKEGEAWFVANDVCDRHRHVNGIGEGARLNEGHANCS